MNIYILHLPMAISTFTGVANKYVAIFNAMHNKNELNLSIKKNQCWRQSSYSVKLHYNNMLIHITKLIMTYIFQRSKPRQLYYKLETNLLWRPLKIKVNIKPNTFLLKNQRYLYYLALSNSQCMQMVPLWYCLSKNLLPIQNEFQIYLHQISKFSQKRGLHINRRKIVAQNSNIIIIDTNWYIR